jgi:sulfur carrier protein
MTICVNDQTRRISDTATLHDLLAELTLVERRGVAVAVNDEVIPRSGWPNRFLAESDHVLVIQATQGG